MSGAILTTPSSAFKLDADFLPQGYLHGTDAHAKADPGMASAHLDPGPCGDRLFSPLANAVSGSLRELGLLERGALGPIAPGTGANRVLRQFPVGQSHSCQQIPG